VANEGKREWFIKLINTRTKRFVNDDTGVFQVYVAGAATRLQINNAAGADVSQSANDLGGDFTSVTMTDGTLRFWTNRTVSAVDVSILTAGGRAYFLDGITQSQHRVDVDPDRSDFVLTVAIDDKASASNIRKLGFQLKKGMVVNDVFINVTAVLTGSSAISNNNWQFGRSGDPNGFIDKTPLTTTGLKTFNPLSITGLVKALQVRGADLLFISTGSDVTTNTGWAQRIPYVVDTATATNNLTMRRTSTATLTVTIGALSGKGYIYYAYTLLPMP
jgi:hypothetical protein